MFRRETSRDVTPFLAQTANDKGENAECKKDREKYGLS